MRAFDNHLRVSLSLPENNAGTLRIVLAAPDAIHVGSTFHQTKLLDKTMPVYPLEAKAQGIHGAVNLRATIGKDGKVENLQVLDGHLLLVAAALDAVRHWEYSSTLLNGGPVAVVTDITVNFTLTK